MQDAENLCAKKISHLFLQLKPVQGHPRWVSSAGSVFFAKDTLTEFQKVVVFESKYCLDPNLNPVAVAEWELGQCKVAEKMPTAMPHIRSLRVGEEIGPEVESGGEIDEEFYEDNLEIDNGTIMEKIEEFREYLEQMKAAPERMEKLSRKLDDIEKEVQPDILPHPDEVVERPNKIDETNIVSTSRSRKQTVPEHTWNQQWGSTLMMQRVLRVFAVIEAGEEVHVRDLTAKMPKNFFEALMRDDWRQWIEAFRKEKQGFILNDVFEEVDGKEDPSDPIVPIVEVNTIKRDGTYKNRDAACGSKRFLAAGIDYNETFQPTGAAVTVRLFFSLMSTTIHIEGVVYKTRGTRVATSVKHIYVLRRRSERTATSQHSGSTANGKMRSLLSFVTC